MDFYFNICAIYCSKKSGKIGILHLQITAWAWKSQEKSGFGQEKVRIFDFLKSLRPMAMPTISVADLFPNFRQK